MAVYIRSAIAISPQYTFLKGFVPDDPVIYENLLQNILPDFKSYFEPLERRRMSKIIKTGATCAIEAIREADIERPDMIISGTGLGCIEDTEKFLNNVLTSEISMHTPTAFVQSTHNSIGALIAVKYKCHGYNVVYANKTVSFEHALLDAMLHFAEGNVNYILLNGFDEITAENYQLKKGVGLFKSGKFTNLDILRSNSSGSIPGEGATSFILSDDLSTANLARIDTVELHYSFEDQEKLKTWIVNSIAKNNLTVTDIDLLVCGINGDQENDAVYKELMATLFADSIHAYYKHLCGEYDTASAFGLWFCAETIKNQIIPSHCLLNNNKRTIHTVLLYGHDQFKNHSLMLISKC
jgi:3-oxoacyl-[acyl-carrier-protein] synthase II